MKELCSVLGIAHSCEGKSWSHQEFEKLVPEVLKLEEKLRKVLGLRAYQGRNKESEFLQASNLLKQVFENWSGAVIEKEASRKK